jgi:hypothetical protein
MQQVPVHIFLSDPDLESTVRYLLSLDPRFRIESRNTHPFSSSGETTFVPLDDTAAASETSVLLFGPNEFVQYEKAYPGYLDHIYRAKKVLLLLKNDEVSGSLGLFRRCDGMIVRDANLVRIADIIAFALHGYFVIPRHLMANFNLWSAPLRSTVLEQIGARQGMGSYRNGRLLSDPSRDVFASKATLNNAIRKGLKQTGLDTDAPARAEKTPTVRNGDAISLPAWRRAFRNNDGRVGTLEYTLLLTVFALWVAILIEGSVFRAPALHCPIAGPASYCQLSSAAK